MQLRSQGNVQEAKKHLQLAIRVCRWLGLTNPGEPWSNWVQTELVQHYSTLSRELYRMHLKRQAVVLTNKHAGELAAEAEQQQQQQQQDQEPTASSEEEQASEEELSEEEHSCSSSHSGQASSRGPASHRAAAAVAGPSKHHWQLLPKPRELLLWQEELVGKALTAAAALQRVKATSWDPVSACMVRDACMLCTLFGYSSLAQRSEVLCAAKASQHAQTACSNSEPPCPDPNCRGVRFECNTGAWQLVVPHHKGTSRGMAGQVLRMQDAQVMKLLTLYEKYARPSLLWGPDSVLAGIDGDDAESGMPLAMFVTGTGQAYTDQSLGEWWRQLHK